MFQLLDFPITTQLSQLCPPLRPPDCNNKTKSNPMLRSERSQSFTDFRQHLGNIGANTDVMPEDSNSKFFGDDLGAPFTFQ